MNHPEILSVNTQLDMAEQDIKQLAASKMEVNLTIHALHELPQTQDPTEKF